MNKFDERYEFRTATIADIDDIMLYIGSEWRKEHILANDKQFFEYEFQDGDKVNFILAIDKSTKLIEGMLGFYAASKNMKCLDVWGSMWSVRKNGNNYPLLGIEISKRFKQLINYRSEIGVGLNINTAVPLLKNRDIVGKLNHYYILNDLQNYKIAEIKNKKIIKTKNGNQNICLKQCFSINELMEVYDFNQNYDVIPYKDSWYINKKYYNHPFYKYSVYAIMEKGAMANAIFVIKEVNYEERKALRIVDYLGDISYISEVSNELINLMDKYCEYIDFYCYGFDEKYILDAGFILNTSDKENIIPNYFEPYVKQNMCIWFNSTAREKFVICKADADQDRPNLIRQKQI